MLARILRCYDHYMPLLRAKLLKRIYRWGYFGKNIRIGRAVKFVGDTSNIFLHDNVEIRDYCVFYCAGAEKVCLENNVSLEMFNIINTRSILSIGQNTMTAPFVTFNTGNHNTARIETIRFGGSIHMPMYIGADCWIGIGAHLLSGAHLGAHCVVAANAVVNRAFEDCSIIAGVPAKYIKKVDIINTRA